MLRHFRGHLIIRTTMYPPYTSKEDLEVMEAIIPKDLKYERQFNEYRDTVTLQNFEHSPLKLESKDPFKVFALSVSIFALVLAQLCQYGVLK